MIFTFQKLKKQLNGIRFKHLEKYMLGYAFVIQLTHIIDKDIEIFSLIKNTISTFVFNHYQYDFKRNNSSDVMFFYSHEYVFRKDHLSSFLKVTESIPNKNVVIGKRIKPKVSVHKLKYIFYFPVWLYQIRNTETSSKQKLQIVLYIALMAYWIDQLVKNQDNLKHHSALITLMDANSYENILVQYCKLHHVPTATLQHGHFTATLPEAKEWHQIGTAFEGFVSDKFFAWGEYTKNEAIKNGITPNKIKCVGCAKYIGYKKIDKIHTNHLFGIVLDGGGELTYKTNIEMIKIANEVAKKKELKYVIKPHPVSEMSKFEQFIEKDYLHRVTDRSESVEEYSKSVGFSLAMGSSVYSELLYIGDIVFRFVSDEFVDRYEEIQLGVVKTAEDFIELIDNYERNPHYIKKMNEKAANILFEQGDIGENYHKAINELVEVNIKQGNIYNAK